MSRCIANRENIRQAAEQELLKNGGHPRRVTNVLIRETLGGGSFKTIGPHLREWLEERLNETVMQYPAPASLVAAEREYMDRLWKLAYGAALKTLDEQLDALEGLQAEVERLQAMIDAQDTQIEDLEATLLTNQRRFVSCIDAIKQQLNVECGGFLEVLKGHDPALAARLESLQISLGNGFKQAYEDQAALLSHYLLSRQTGTGAEAPPAGPEAEMPAAGLKAAVTQQLGRLG